MELKDRVLSYCGKKNIALARFEKESKLSNGYFNQVKKRPSIDKIKSIEEAFPDLNIEWLLTGEGEMLKSGQPVPVKSYTRGVPYYNVDFLGGFDVILNDQTVVPEFLIDFETYNRATCWCNITGHSMEPEITSGDIIALREVKDFSFLPLGEVYAIVTTNGLRTVKRLGPSSDPDRYSLVPANKSPEYGVQEIPKAMIARVYEVLGCMKKL